LAHKSSQNPFFSAYPKSNYSAHSQKNICLFSTSPPYCPIIYTTCRPSDLGPPIRRLTLISNCLRCLGDSSRKLSDHDVRARPRVAPRLYREAACQNRSRTISGPMEELTALVIPPHVTHASPLRHCHLSVISAPDPPSLQVVCHVPHPCGPLTDHHVITPYHDPTYDVMLTSSKKRAKAQNVNIWPKITVFRTFSTKDHCAPCMQFHDHFAANLLKLTPEPWPPTSQLEPSLHHCATTRYLLHSSCAWSIPVCTVKTP